jgi:hypothetical protein
VVYLFDVYGEPVSAQDRVAHWTTRDLAALAGDTEALALETARLLDAVLRSASFELPERAPGPVRYENDRGHFYERAVVLEQAQNRLVMRALGGAIKSVIATEAQDPFSMPGETEPASETQ